MVWVRLADDFTDHPKIVAAGPLASWLYVCGLTYANRYLTDGFIPTGQVRRLADVDDALGLAAVLVSAGLWEPAEGGYLIHDYHGYQPKAEAVKQERVMRETRKELYADPIITKFVKARDVDRCRYCAVLVRWSDRKGRAGGTLDHVVPDGGNSVDNIVVACRACNSRKGRRTPEQAGMPLLRPGTTGVPDKSDLVLIQPVSIHPARPGPDPDPDPVLTTPQPPPQAEGERAETRRRGRGAKHEAPVPLGPLNDGDRELWTLAAERLRPDMNAANFRHCVEPIQPVGRAPDGGLQLRAPPGMLVGRFRGQICRALADVGDPAAGQVQIFE